ncbi:hypothetical protein K2173_028544 [Erythroxylum novogranatense]|uniref:Transcription factor C2H2 family n=1 Tax=Erythroxylum novogranatense TaxID=1862640 RepID=A0AAV8U253_9ROSI|nr:hypothetical protein K2173_028544 [Erythroxylum novogranatense]
MAKSSKERCTPELGNQKRQALLQCSRKIAKVSNSKVKHPRRKTSDALEKKDWEGATCSVCLECPHKAVLLLCSSYKKGCRPYMCSTSRRFSNCLDQYKKAYSKINSTERSQQGNRSMDDPSFSLLGQVTEEGEVPELLCPLCRGQVKGWTVVERARKYLNAKKRNCMEDSCSFVGTYKQLKKHVRAKHPLARPRAVDPIHEEKWKKFECERERNDVISTIMSSSPGAVVLGDYVIEPGYRGVYHGYDSEDSLDDRFISLEPLNQEDNSGLHYHGGVRLHYDSFDDNDYDRGNPVAGSAGLPRRGVYRLLGRRWPWRFRGV